MSLKQRWLLPEGIDELMPEQTAQLELLRRQLLDKMTRWGYQLVFPPLVEYLDSLLTGTGKALDLQTFKLTDQMSGRLMGVRADMTPQVARIAAHNLRGKAEVMRLCYIGNTLNTRPQGQGMSRNPIQLGAEIYGHAGCESDMEIVTLMVDTLTINTNSSDLLLDIGHVGIYRGLAQEAGLDSVQEQALFTVLQRKSAADIEDLLADYSVTKSHHAMLLALADLNGGVDILSHAKQILKTASKPVQKALATLEEMVTLIQQRLPNMALNIDLAELRGYHYHTGIVFAVYQAGTAAAIAMGGRYDDIGADFGHAQPATGFSLDLKVLVNQLPVSSDEKPPIYIKWSNDDEDKKKVAQLRKQGEVVIYQFESQ